MSLGSGQKSPFMQRRQNISSERPSLGSEFLKRHYFVFFIFIQSGVLSWSLAIKLFLLIKNVHAYDTNTFVEKKY